MYGSFYEPLTTFGEEHLPLFQEKAYEAAPGACAAREMLINTWNPKALSHDVIAPDGHTMHKRVWVQVDYKISEPLLDKRNFTFRTDVNIPSESEVKNAADGTHFVDAFVVREICRRCNYNPSNLRRVKKLIEERGELKITNRTKFVSLVWVDKINKDNIDEYDDNFLARLLELINESLNTEPFNVAIIHDDFGCAPIYVNQMRKHYNRILHDIYYSDLILDIIEQLTGQVYNLPEPDDEVAQAILNNNYAIN